LLVAGAAGGASQKQVRVGLVLEQPLVGRVDDPFQHSAYLGLARAVKELHVEGKVVAPPPTGSYVPPMSFLARQGYDLTIGIGYLEARDLGLVAPRFPKSKFVLLDARHSDVPHGPPNVQGTNFRTEQPAYLAGYLAAKLEQKRPRPHVVSSIGGFKIPPVDAFIAGFQAGAKAADPSVKTLNVYTNDFTSSTKCEHAARDQIARGSGVIFDVAGACGLGALKVAGKSGVYGIGVDIDQSYLGPYILTSVIKRLDVAVYDFAKAAHDGTLRTGGDEIFDLENHGVALGKFSPRVPVALRRTLARLATDIVEKRIVIPTRVTKR
jgi:basic membrane protein A and related proteins